MTSVKAALTVTLKADEVVVAEIQDPVLWQRILTAINNGKSTLGPSEESVDGGGAAAEKGIVGDGSGGGASPLDSLAAQLGVEPSFVEGACSPGNESPYMHLDLHCWEEMKKQVPPRGITAISPIIVPATLLGLWFRKAGLGNPTQAQAQAVLATINTSDRNASRAIQNTSWLQGRPGGQIVLNPAEISKAVKLAKCFCSKDWTGWSQ